MTQEKMRKIITASVSAATLLLVFLLSFLVYQWITMAVLNKRIAKAEEQVAYYEEVIAKNEKDLSYYESILGKNHLAIQNGFVHPSED